MSDLFSKILGVLNADLSRHTWHRNVPHPYFESLTYFGHEDPTRCYWEAEIADPELSEKISITMQGTEEGPTPSEQEFCQRTISDLDGLFAKCRSAFEPEFISWAEQPFPAEWRKAFLLVGFSVPPQGDASQPWEVTYFVEPANHYFTAEFESDRVVRVVIDG